MSFLQIFWAIILFPLAIVAIWMIFIVIITIICMWQCREPKDRQYCPPYLGGLFGNWFGPR